MIIKCSDPYEYGDPYDLVKDYYKKTRKLPTQIFLHPTDYDAWCKVYLRVAGPNMQMVVMNPQEELGPFSAEPPDPGVCTTIRLYVKCMDYKEKEPYVI